MADSHPDFRREILALARKKSCAASKVIYRASDAGRDIFGIRAGVIAVQCRFTHPDVVLLHMLRPGDWFGTVPLLTDQSRRINVIARTDVELLRVPSDYLQALLRRHREWSAELGRDVV
ncbi:MAG: cyclic nucleotide-binding domain-containing protein [Thiobacillus sp.]|nr:cyclic nucleotide-binding domain-containing protein [Thiobacillus sp.]